ncbi:hypothetical protein [Sphingomonas nostoxanthinifaciens]|uniref:hypothetical protein n=1 Tax=Sphingomonas nostoxanthinifaciens TaxID=2872652 RepID=UPI001CC1E1F6|nr:hypothetical protein [Sphingomonas nostoxanthinifaciens]UAK22960.1 hypothetical protein K8P63_10990 [Sphingomonas nostoxanthinifaciens]
MRIAAPLLPVRRRPSALVLLVGGCSLLLLLAAALAHATAAAPPRLMVQVVAADDAERAADADKAIAILRAQPGVRAARQVDPSALADMAGPLPADQPALPALIEVTLAADASEAALGRALAPVRDAAMQPRGPASAPSPLHRLALFATLVAGMSLIGGAVAIARDRLSRRAVTVTLLRELGAEDARIARTMLHDPALDTLAGLGGALAVALLLLGAAGQLGWGMAGGLVTTALVATMLCATAAMATTLLSLARRP